MFFSFKNSKSFKYTPILTDGHSFKSQKKRKKEFFTLFTIYTAVRKKAVKRKKNILITSSLLYRGCGDMFVNY